MIGRLRGSLLEKGPERIILDVQGVGYELRVPLSTYGVLPEVGDPMDLLVHTQVREDEITLFGFATRMERTLFERMLSVSGVGPRIAMALVSGLPTEDLLEAIRDGDVRRLSRVPGVGKKTAERLVVDLRDKLSQETAQGRSAAGGDSDSAGGQGKAKPRVEEDVMSALVNLGYSVAQSERAVEEACRGARMSPEVPSGPSFEELLKFALRSVVAAR